MGAVSSMFNGPVYNNFLMEFLNKDDDDDGRWFLRKTDDDEAEAHPADCDLLDIEGDNHGNAEGFLNYRNYKIICHTILVEFRRRIFLAKHL